MPSELNDGDRERVSEVMRALMVQNALHHKGDDPFRSVDAFSATILEQRGLLTVTVVTPRSDDLTAILTTPTHPQRADAPPGPRLFVKGTEGKGAIIDPAELLAEGDPTVRLAVLRYFETLPPGTVARRSLNRLEEVRSQIAAEVCEQWLPAAQALDDLLRHDIYLALAGFRQSYFMGIEQGIQEYLPQVLRPKAGHLASVEVEVWNPSEEGGALAKMIQRFAQLPTLSDALEAYYCSLGHLPLTGVAGMGQVIREWTAAHGPVDLWAELWSWADRRSSPLPRYHVCAAFLRDGTTVPVGAETTLWSEIARIVDVDTEEPVGTQSTEAWLLREELACHYGYYLECLTPGVPSERLMGMAWWLTERFSELLPASAGLLSKVRKTTVRNELERSGLMNQATHPPTVPSGLRYLSRVTNRTWSTALLGELSGARWLLERPLPEAERLRIEGAVIRAVYQCYPAPAGERTPPVYGFERPLEPLVSDWVEVVSATEADKRTDMQELSGHAGLLRSDESVSDFMIALATADPKSLDRIAQAIRTNVYLGHRVAQTLWDEFSKDQRWKTILSRAEENTLALLFESLTELAVQVGGQWRWAVPHMFAAAAEECHEVGRRLVLFGFALFSSLHTGTVSAVQRLMHGPLRPEFAEYAVQWRRQLKAAYPAFTPWAAGRIRSLVPSLSPDELSR